MNVDAIHGKRVMTCISLRIKMTPEELQGVLMNLNNVEKRSSVNHSVATKVFIGALEEAAKPRTGRSDAMEPATATAASEALEKSEAP